MKVVSTNLGEKQTIKWRGKDIYTGIYKYPVNQPIVLGKHDVVHDQVIDRRYHGGLDKACYLYSSDHYAFWKSKFPNLDWQYGMFGENLSISGLDEAKLHIGDIFKIGTATVQITQPRQPCYKLGIRFENAGAVKLFVEAEFPGAYIRIIEEGTIEKGDTMVLLEQKKANVTLQEIFHLIYNAKENIDKVKRAIDIPELADSCRKDLIKYAGLHID